MRSPNLPARVRAGAVVLACIALTPAALPARPLGGVGMTMTSVAHVPVHVDADTAPRRRANGNRSSRASRAGAVMRTSRAVVSAARLETGPQGRRVQRALARLGSRVNTSDRDALRMAFRAYYAYKAAHPEKVKKPYLYFVDYGLDAGTPRGYVFDMRELRIVEGPFRVAHGRGSAPRGGVPRRFSNRRGSEATSLGLFLAQETYRFSGKSGGRRYTSTGLRLRGLSGRFNARAR